MRSRPDPTLSVSRETSKVSCSARVRLTFLLVRGWGLGTRLWRLRPVSVHLRIACGYLPKIWAFNVHAYLSSVKNSSERLLPECYGMYFVSKFNALKFNGKDRDYRECNGFKVSVLVHWIILRSHYWILQQTSLKFRDLLEFIFVSLNWLQLSLTSLNCFATSLNFLLLHWIAPLNQTVANCSYRWHSYWIQLELHLSMFQQFNAVGNITGLYR